MAIGNMSAVELAKQRAEQQGGGGNAQFFSLKEGEKTYLRFLTGMIDSKVVSHDCGLTMYDYHADKWEDEASAGNPHICPGCGQPLTDENVLFDRSEHYVADYHNFFPTSDGADKKASFVCLASEVNAGRGWVPVTEGGMPMYQCPACACQYNKNKETGQPRRPAMRLTGIAVEREVKVSQQIVNGIPTQVVEGVQDVMTEVDGKVQPKLVIVQMGWNNFWQKLSNFDQSYEQSICLYDWCVTRIGNGLQTTYDIQKVDTQPSVIDLRQYAEYLPDVPKLIKGQGNPAYYVKKGYSVPGYVPDDQPQQNAAGTAAAAIQNVAMGIPQQGVTMNELSTNPPQYEVIPTANPQAQPIPQQVQQQVIPQGVPQQAQAGANDWTVVQNQFA